MVISFTHGVPYSPMVTSTPINTISHVALYQRLLHNVEMIDNDNVEVSRCEALARNSPGMMSDLTWSAIEADNNVCIIIQLEQSYC